jgi:hypothetical protein
MKLKLHPAMVTIGRWQNDVMIEDWLMWDNQSLMKHDRVSPVDAHRLTRQG